MGAFAITLREGFEAALIVGLILAYLMKTGQHRHAPAVWWGVAAAVVTSLAIGAILFLSAGELEGTSEALYEGSAMILAAAVVTWMAFWMRKQAATIGQHLREQVSESLRTGSSFALAAVAFIATSREGLETALFLFASTEDSGPGVVIAGGLVGLAAAIALGIAFYRGALRLDLGKFFTVTSLLVIAFAAYLLYGGIHELGEAADREALESAAPFAALLYGAGFASLYVRDSVVRRRAARRAEPSEAQA